MRDEDRLTPSHPTRKLGKFLLLNGSRRARNAWRNEETTNLNYFADKGVPEVK